MKHEIKQGGWWEDSRGAVAAREAKKYHRELTKDLRAANRSLGDLEERYGWAEENSKARAEIAKLITLKKEYVWTIKVEADKVQREALTAGFN